MQPSAVRHQLSGKNIFLCLFSAITLILSFPAVNVWVFAWVGFIPLFFCLKNKTKLNSFIFAYLTGLVFWWGVIYWLCHVTVLGTAILIFYLSIYFGLFGLCVYFIYNSKLPTLYSLFFLSSSWVALEYLRSYSLTGFPWALLGYSQYLNNVFIQIADLTGAWGVSFAVIFINAAVFLLINNLKNKKLKIKLLFIIFISLFIIYGYGFYRIKKLNSSAKTTPLRISVVQGNIPQELKWDYSVKDAIFEKYINLSKAISRNKTDLIIWPEASLPVIPEEEPDYLDRLKELSVQTNTAVLVGSVTSRQDLYYNSAILVSPNSEKVAIYDKMHLVPFGEYIPLGKALPFLKTVVPIGEISRGKEFVIFNLSESVRKFPVKFSVLICFEDVFPEISRQFVKKGAKFLVNITNDAWYKKTSASRQHLQASVFRAVENHVYLVRSANTGISAYISPAGKIINKVQDSSGADIFITGVLSDNIYLGKSKFSFYNKFGEIFVIICFILTALFLTRKRKNV